MGVVRKTVRAACDKLAGRRRGWGRSHAGDRRMSFGGAIVVQDVTHVRSAERLGVSPGRTKARLHAPTIVVEEGALY